MTCSNSYNYRKWQKAHAPQLSLFSPFLMYPRPHTIDTGDSLKTAGWPSTASCNGCAVENYVNSTFTVGPLDVVLLFSHSVVSNSLWPHSMPGFPVLHNFLKFASDSWALSQWYHPAISSSVIPFSSCLQTFPGTGSSPVSCLFTSGGQNIEASASVLPMNIQGWFPLGWTVLTSSLS